MQPECLAFAIPLVLLNSHQIAASNVIQLEMATTDFDFLQTYVQSDLCSAKRSTRE